MSLDDALRLEEANNVYSDRQSLYDGILKKILKQEKAEADAAKEKRHKRY